MEMNKILIFSVLAIFSISCSSAGNASVEYDTVHYSPEYASGFDIVGNMGCSSRVVRVKCAWQEADSTAMELFIARGGERPPKGFKGQVLEDHASRLAVMSSSYVGLLSSLDACDSIAAISGKKFISDPEILRRMDDILEISSDSDPDYEGLLSCPVDLVLIYGISSQSPMEKKLVSLGIPYFYMGEYLEEDPLGRAEWIVPLAEILGIREKGESEFRSIVHRYDSLKTVAAGLSSRKRPAVMLNSPYGDTWFMASPRSSIVRMIRDAGGEYVYKGNDTNRSTPVDREEAFMLASSADIWLDTGSISTLEELARACPGFASVECFRKGLVYNNDARKSPGGGNEFWETAPAHPDLVLQDLIRIFHPEATVCDSLYYYRKLPYNNIK